MMGFLNAICDDGSNGTKEYGDDTVSIHHERPHYQRKIENSKYDFVFLFFVYTIKKQYLALKISTGKRTKHCINYDITPEKMRKGNSKRRSMIKKENNENNTIQRSKRIRVNEERKEREETLISLLNKDRRKLLTKIINNPDVGIDWKEYVKELDLWIPQKEDSDQDSEDSRFDSEEWEEPDYNPKYEYFSTQQELRTTDKIAEDLVKEVIQLAIQYVTNFYEKMRTLINTIKQHYYGFLKAMNNS